MINNIIAFSDVHTRPLKRHEEYKKVFNKLISKIKAYSPDRVVIAGDLFHNKLIISNESSILIAKLIDTIAKHTKVIILPGNHDTVIGSDRVDSITPLIEIMNNENVVYYKHSGCFEDKWDKDVVWAVWSCLEHQKDPEIREYKQDNDPNGDKHYIALYHGVINGSTTDLGFTFTDEGIDAEAFYHSDLLIAGDIHKHQTYKYKNYKGEGFGIMCSSLVQQDYGEFLENHGYNVLEYKNDKWEHFLVEIENEYNYHTLVLRDYEELENI